MDCPIFLLVSLIVCCCLFGLGYFAAAPYSSTAIADSRGHLKTPETSTWSGRNLSGILIEPDENDDDDDPFICCIMAPSYLSVPRFQDCLGDKNMGTFTVWCLPAVKPANCLDGSWQELQNLDKTEPFFPCSPTTEMTQNQMSN
jgi:hypothetical protein